MNIGLINVDSKMPNLALMKISAWHKKQGNTVEFFNPMFSQNIDKIYISKVFSFTPDFQYNLPDVEIIKGGSGYSLDSYLPEGIESIYPDYSLFNCDYAMGFTTRGCIRTCPFCIVPKKEGEFKVVSDIYQFWNGQKELLLLDNNLTADTTHFELICNQIIKEKISVDFNQGLDIRLIDGYKAYLLSKVKLIRYIRFSFDNINMECTVKKNVNKLFKSGVKPYKIFFYFLIGFNSTPEEDMARFKILMDLKVNIFAMPFNGKDNYQKQFSRWINNHIYKLMSFKTYLKSKI